MPYIALTILNQQVLNRLCKTEIPNEVVKFIRDSTYTFGKAKVILLSTHRANCFLIAIFDIVGVEEQ
jgi:hypothetical protein